LVGFALGFSVRFKELAYMKTPPKKEVNENYKYYENEF
jgi:hypothetical protein